MPVFEAGKTYALFASPANKKIISQLENAGANTILFPEVETREIETDSQRAENLLKNLPNFDWIIFTDVYAVDYFLRALEKFGIDFFELDALRVCVFGETIADRLRFAQVHSDLISNLADSDEVFKALGDYDSNFESSRFLIPREIETSPEISNRLLKTGAGVTELALYRRQINEANQLPKLKALLKGGAIDEFIFCSPTEATKLSILFPSENISGLLTGITVSATSSTTLQSLQEYGITGIMMR